MNFDPVSAASVPRAAATGHPVPRRPFRAAATAVAAAAMLLAACSGGSSTPGPGPTPPPPPPPVTTATLLAAGDIGECGYGALDTGRLIDGLSGTLLALGDLAYMHGSAANFRDCYDPAWGRHMDRTRPVPGNHDYETPGAAGYFDYFGGLAGNRGQGYYSYSAGPWRVIALNSEISMAAGSPQVQWLRDELQANRTQCTLAYWHRPLYSSGPNGNNLDTRVLWSTLIEFGAEIVLNGHDHMYERFERQDDQARPDPVNGLRQFTVGTGGAHLTNPGPPKPNSAARSAASYGVLQLTLNPTSYSWEFIPANNAFRDSGAGTCR
ncbi:MAG TPA: metallophosphoesterase [Vicinamibacterales bacterium]|nr:metallophosphoesterase [Vicinamibacterales bacterium]